MLLFLADQGDPGQQGKHLYLTEYVGFGNKNFVFPSKSGKKSRKSDFRGLHLFVTLPAQYIWGTTKKLRLSALIWAIEQAEQMALQKVMGIFVPKTMNFLRKNWEIMNFLSFREGNFYILGSYLMTQDPLEMPKKEAWKNIKDFLRYGIFSKCSFWVKNAQNLSTTQ